MGIVRRLQGTPRGAALALGVIDAVKSHHPRQGCRRGRAVLGARGQPRGPGHDRGGGRRALQALPHLRQAARMTPPTPGRPSSSPAAGAARRTRWHAIAACGTSASPPPAACRCSCGSCGRSRHRRASAGSWSRSTIRRCVAGLPELAALASRGRLRVLDQRCRASAARSPTAFDAAGPPLLVTTADHALLEPAMVEARARRRRGRRCGRRGRPGERAGDRRQLPRDAPHLSALSRRRLFRRQPVRPAHRLRRRAPSRSGRGSSATASGHGGWRARSGPGLLLGYLAALLDAGAGDGAGFGPARRCARSPSRSRSPRRRSTSTSPPTSTWSRPSSPSGGRIDERRGRAGRGAEQSAERAQQVRHGRCRAMPAPAGPRWPTSCSSRAWTSPQPRRLSIARACGCWS